MDFVTCKNYFTTMYKLSYFCFTITFSTKVFSVSTTNFLWDNIIKILYEVPTCKSAVTLNIIRDIQ